MMWEHGVAGSLVKFLPLIELVAGFIATILAGVGFVNLSWAEGASSAALKKQSARKARRLFIAAGVFAVITGVCFYLSVRS